MMKKKIIEKKSQELRDLDKKFPRNAISSPEIMPKKDNILLDSKKPLKMDIEEGEKVITGPMKNPIF